MENNNDFEKNGGGLKEADNSRDELNRELEEIAQTFREELKKACEEAEKTEDISTETNNAEEPLTSEEEITDEELCKCCGERAVDEECGEYCEECYTAMQKHPFSFSSIVAAVVVVVSAFLSLVSFIDYSEGYAKTVASKSLVKDNKLSSALVAYDEAIELFEDESIAPKKLYFESAELISRTMDNGSASMDDIIDRIGKGLENSNGKLPVYKKTIELREETLSLYGTMQSFYSIMQKEEYADFDAENTELYNKIITEIEALKGTTVTITDIDGKSTKEIPVDESMVCFCQYMLAFTVGNSADAEKYITASYELNPEYLWLHSYEVAVNKIKAGDLAGGKAIAEALLKNNIEESDGYCLYSYASRMSGDIEKAVEWAEKGSELCPGNAELLRYRAMAYIVAGDFESAKECTDEAMAYEQYVLLYYTAIIAENELGNTQAVNELVSAIENQGIEISERMNDYLNGSVNATEIFTKGSGDVE